jgi:formate transporter
LQPHLLAGIAHKRYCGDARRFGYTVVLAKRSGGDVSEEQQGNGQRNQGAIDNLLPSEMALKAERVGETKAGLDGIRLFALAILAGAFISFGAMFATVTAAGAADMLPFGLTRLLAGLTFSLGLILVIVGGAELFTGNALIVMAWAARRVSTLALLRNWLIVFIGNLVGSLATAALIFASGQYSFGGGAVGATALATAAAKTDLAFGQALALGILCNVLVCLAVWLCFSARTVAGKISAIILPVAAFVAGGFEHSIANMYFLPLGLMIKGGAGADFWAAIAAQPADYGGLTIAGVILNLVPVTIGNVIGGGVLVGAVYWFVYLRHR